MTLWALLLFALWIAEGVRGYEHWRVAPRMGDYARFYWRLIRTGKVETR